VVLLKSWPVLGAEKEERRKRNGEERKEEREKGERERPFLFH